MSYPHPNLPDLLFKFTSADGIFATLGGGSLRFSRPTLFNDLHDCTLIIAKEIDREAVVARTIEQVVSSVMGRDSSPLVGPLGGMIRLLKSNAGKFTVAELTAELRPGIEESLDRIPELAAKYRGEIDNFHATSKVFCLSADRFSAPLWGNYAQNLAGAVLGFGASVEADSLFLAANPVSYTDERPSLIDQDSAVEYLSGRKVMSEILHYERAVYAKSTQWEYENEWRIVAGHGWQPENEIEYISFHKPDLREVIVGSRFDKGRIHELRRLLESYPNARLYELDAGAGVHYGYHEI